MNKISIDIWRFIVTFLVIAIHISPFIDLNIAFDLFFTRILGRVAVPLFLMITGYYIIEKSLNNKEELKKYTKKILKIYLFCILLYLPITIYTRNFSFNLLKIAKDIIFNGTFYHLWYFPALIMGLWITYYLIKKFKKDSFYILFVCYILGLLGDSYYGIIKQSEILTFVYNILFSLFNYTRNGIFFTPIFLYLGYQVKISNKSKPNINLIFLFLICITVEGFLIHHYHLDKHDSMYLFLVPLMYFLFQFCIQNKTPNKKIRDIATIMYIFHPLWIIIIRGISKKIGYQKILVQNHLVLYVIVSFFTFLFSFGIQKLKSYKKM